MGRLSSTAGGAAGGTTARSATAAGAGPMTRSLARDAPPRSLLAAPRSSPMRRSPAPARAVSFRPCIDIHAGQVKQIVGSTLGAEGEGGLETNFISARPASWFARRYQEDGLTGGHVILLGRDEATAQAAREAVAAAPGTLQVGGGVTPETARAWVDAGASAVIVTSMAFREGRLDLDALSRLADAVGGTDRVVLDLSVKKDTRGGASRRASPGRPSTSPGDEVGVPGSTPSPPSPAPYVVVADRWKTWTDLVLDEGALARLGELCGELLVHAVDVEGKQEGPDERLVGLLAASPVPVTYAGGVRSLADLDTIREAGRDAVDVTIGSALDVFGGTLPYSDVLRWHRSQRGRV